MKTFDKFYKKNLAERLEILKEESKYDLALDTPLSIDDADYMIENLITTFELPFGIVPNFLIDQKTYIVPMVIEEPSVIAGASFAAKFIGRYGGFKTVVHGRLMIGQIFFMDVTDINALIENLKAYESKLFEVAQRAHPGIVSRGGGLERILYVKRSDEQQKEHLVLYAHINVKEAMGANIMNSILEALADEIRDQFNQPVLMGILSNLATESLVTATCQLPILAFSNQDEAHKIALASNFSHLDIYRAATHNKGIMNGIDAVVIATGNDFRAIEAGVHAYAALDGYKPLSTWWVQNDVLHGKITVPLSVGVVGHYMQKHQKARLAHLILGHPSAKELMSIIASVGLAQNLAALRALVTVGIQKGHMRLHARTVAKNAGASDQEIEVVAKELSKIKDYSLETAKRIIQALKIKK